MTCTLTGWLCNVALQCAAFIALPLLSADYVTSPASPMLLDNHKNGRMSIESLKRAREVLETPLSLRLDVLAGPAQNKSYTTDAGVTQVSRQVLCSCCTLSQMPGLISSSW